MKTGNAFTLAQKGALITLTVVALWSLGVTWLPLNRPLGINYTEILFLSALVPGYLVLLPLYGLRVRWSYINGILVMLGLFVGLAKSILDNTFFFSWSFYNLTMVVALLCAATCIYLSLRSYQELPPLSWAKGALGIGGVLMISGIAVFLVSQDPMRVENYVLRRVIQGVQARTGDIEALDEKIKVLMDEGDMHSLVAAIVVNDEVVWIQGFGQEPAPNKVYDIGSVTKPFIATAVLQLYEQELIDLDDDINQYLPFDVRHPDYPDVPITIRMLLTNRACLSHKTGLYDAYLMGPELRQWGMANRGWEYRDELETLSYPEFMAAYLQPGGTYYQPENWANCHPGREYVYSTPGFDLLGYLVEQVSGQPLNEYLQTNIFMPLQMSSTTATPLDAPERMAIPYERWYGVLAKTNVRLPLTQRRRIGGGGLYATAADLSNFLIAHMNQGQFGDFQLLEPATIQLMHGSASQTSDDFMQVGYGYGWSIYQKEPRQMWNITYQPRGYQGHGGRYWGYTAQMNMVAAEGGAYGYMLLSNNSMVESMDSPWYFSVQANIQDLLLNEAYRMYQVSLK